MPEPHTPAWKRAQRERLPFYRIVPFREAVTKMSGPWQGVAHPTDKGLTRRDGRKMQYWSDGSLRHAQ